MEHDYEVALGKLRQLAADLKNRYPAAAASIEEGMEETLSVHKLKLPGLLRQTLASTNALESANSVCAGVIRRVTSYKTGEMAIRQAAAGFLEAERGFYRIKGYKELPFLHTELKKTLCKNEVGDMVVA